MLDGDLAWEGCARNSGVVKVIEKHLRGGRRAGTACAKIICRSVCVCVCVCVCSRQMDAFITYEDDDSKATKKQNSKHDQAVSNLFRQCVSRNSPGAEGRAELSFV